MRRHRLISNSRLQRLGQVSPPRLSLLLLVLVLGLSLGGCGFEVTGLGAIAEHTDPADISGGGDVGADGVDAPDVAEDGEQPETDITELDGDGPEVTPEITPEVSPEVTPEIAPEVEPEIIEDDDGDGVPNDEDLCPNDADALNLDADDDGAGDVCDECPFLAGAGPCPSDWNNQAMAGSWRLFRFSLGVSDLTPLVANVTLQPEAGADEAFVLKLGAELTDFGSGHLVRSGHLWLEILPSASFNEAATFQGMLSRLGDKIFLQRVTQDGRQRDEMLVLLRQPKASIQEVMAQRPPAADPDWIVTGLATAVVPGESDGKAAALLQVARFDEPKPNVFPLTLSNEDALDANRVRLIQPASEGYVEVDPASVAVKTPQPQKTQLAIRLADISGFDMNLPVELNLNLDGAMSYFGELGIFLHQQNIGGKALTLLVVLQTTWKNPQDAEDLGLPFYRLGSLDAVAHHRVRGVLLDPTGPGSALDALSLRSGVDADGNLSDALCRSQDVDYWSFQGSRNPYGHVTREECLAAGGDPTVESFAYIWMSAVSSTGSLVLPDVGVGLVSGHEDLFDVPMGRPGLQFYVRAPTKLLDAVLTHYDADMDGIPSASAGTDCEPLVAGLGKDKCPCQISNKESDDGCIQ